MRALWKGGSCLAPQPKGTVVVRMQVSPGRLALDLSKHCLNSTNDAWACDWCRGDVGMMEK